LDGGGGTGFAVSLAFAGDDEFEAVELEFLVAFVVFVAFVFVALPGAALPASNRRSGARSRREASAPNSASV